jgi:hypothetical protein
MCFDLAGGLGDAAGRHHLAGFTVPHHAIGGAGERTLGFGEQPQPGLSAAKSGTSVANLMTKQNEHGRLIAAAAKAALMPLGCRRLGQSRCWILDERYWMILVEFQPSAWSKGSYLNVAPVWLWLRYGGNDYHPRPHSFIAFESADQFTPLIEHMAAVAAQSVLEMRSRFRTLADINRFFGERISQEGFPVYRAAVTAGLAGDVVTARQLFNRMEALDPEGYGPWIKLKAECAALGAQLDDPGRYRLAMLDVIAKRRRQFKLPADPACLESTDSRAAV